MESRRLVLKRQSEEVGVKVTDSGLCHSLDTGRRDGCCSRCTCEGGGGRGEGGGGRGEG